MVEYLKAMWHVKVTILVSMLNIRIWVQLWGIRTHISNLCITGFSWSPQINYHSKCVSFNLISPNTQRDPPRHCCAKCYEFLIPAITLKLQDDELNSWITYVCSNQASFISVMSMHLWVTTYVSASRRWRRTQFKTWGNPRDNIS